MTDDDKALVERLWDHARNVGGDLSYDRLYGSEACQAADLIEAQAAEIKRLREIVYRYVDPFDVTPEDKAFVQSVIDAVLQEQSK